MSFADWSPVAASNSTTLGVSIAENCPPGNVNDAIRKLMSDLRIAIDPAMDAFLGSSSVDAARLALGVTEGSASLNALGALINEANQMVYMTGSDGWAKTALTSFARTMLATGDAAAMLALLGITSTLSAGTFGTNTVSVSIPLGSGGTLLLQAGTGTASIGGSGTAAFPTPYSQPPVCVLIGGNATAGQQGDVHPNAAATATGQSYTNSNTSASCTYSWIAIGVA